MIKRHELWRKQYRAKRYMEHLTDEELNQRGRDVFVNFLTISQEGLISPINLQEGGIHFLTLWTHYLEECMLRKFDYESSKETFMKEVNLPDPRSSKVSQAINAIKNYDLKTGNKLFRQ